MGISAYVTAFENDDDKGLIDLEKAQTVAFISLVWSENVRAYIARSFDRPITTDMFSNRYMQGAIGIAQMALYVAVLFPPLAGVLGLAGLHIGWEGWLAALAGAVACLVLCEAYKLILRLQRRCCGGRVSAAKEAPKSTSVSGNVD